MAKKRPAPRARRPDEPSSPPPVSPGLEAAASDLEQARAALWRAETSYRRARRAMAEQTESGQDLALGELLDGALALARRYPAAGLLTAGTIGFLLGRWLPR